MKTQGQRSRIEGADAIAIKSALAPWLVKAELAKGDVKSMVEALDSAGMKSSIETKLNHRTAKKWWNGFRH